MKHQGHSAQLISQTDKEGPDLTLHIPILWATEEVALHRGGQKRFSKKLVLGF